MTPLPILLFGQNGQVASALVRAAPAANVSLNVLTRGDADFADPAQVARVLMDAPAAALVVNATAYTDVNRAEGEQALAFRVNAESVGALAGACATRGLPLIHLSTDYVFDGKKSSPYVEDDAVHPLNVYGASKLEGENRLRATWEQHVILRTSWVYSTTGNNFLRTILRLGAEREALTIVGDQHGAPTAADNIAHTVLAVATRIARGQGVFGTFHFTDGGETSWYGFAREIASLAGLKTRFLPIPTIAFPTPARRPLNSRLDCSRIRTAYSVEQIPWQTALASVLKELLAQSKGAVI